MRLSVLDAFESTWSNARSTFGDGTPETGAQFDGSAKLTQLQNSVSTAAPDGRWTGPASSAYGAANQDHGRVLGQMAGLDQRLGAAVDQSAQVVATGRQNLDAVRNWVMAAAASVPPGPNRDQMLLPIVQKGLSRISDIVSRSNGDLTKIGDQIRLIGHEYEALGDQRFAPKQDTGPDLQNIKGDEKPAGTDRAAKDWADVRAGTATPEQVARLRAAATLTPEQTAAVQQGKPATIDQGQYDYLNGLMRAQDGMSAAEINKTLDKYPDVRGAMGDAYRIMGNADIQAANGEHGGIGNEPNRIQALLNDDLKYQTGSRPGSG